MTNGSIRPLSGLMLAALLWLAPVATSAPSTSTTVPPTTPGTTKIPVAPAAAKAPSPAVAPKPAPPTPFGPELVVYSGSIPPYSYVENDSPAGVAVELFEAMAKIVGHSGKISMLPWKRAVRTVELSLDQPALILPLNRSPERESRFAWVVPLLKDETVLTTKRGRQPRIEDPAQARTWSVGVLLGSPLEVELKERGFAYVAPAVDEETNAKKLHADHLDAWFVATMVAPFVYRRLGYDPAELDYGAKLQVNDLYLGATKNLPDAELKRWRDAWDALQRKGKVEAILAKYRPRS